MATTSVKAVFLDRDGTLNHDPGYLNDSSQLKLLPGVGEGLRLIQDAGFLLVVISNQSGVARGLVDPGNLEKIEKALQNSLSAYGVNLEHYYYCTHHPDEKCECRKPKPKLIFDAAADLDVDLERSYVVGDRESDLLAGRNAGVKNVALVRSGYGKEVEAKISQSAYDYVGESFLDVARWIAQGQSS